MLLFMITSVATFTEDNKNVTTFK